MLRPYIAMKILWIVAAALLAGCAQTERAEGVAAEIEAAQMEGRTAARKIVNREWTDTVQLMQALREARSVKLRYDTTGHAEAAAAFDSTFVSTLRAVRPNAAKLISNEE